MEYHIKVLNRQGITSYNHQSTSINLTITSKKTLLCISKSIKEHYITPQKTKKQNNVRQILKNKKTEKAKKTQFSTWANKRDNKIKTENKQVKKVILKNTPTHMRKLYIWNARQRKRERDLWLWREREVLVGTEYVGSVCSIDCRP